MWWACPWTRPRPPGPALSELASRSVGPPSRRGSGRRRGSARLHEPDRTLPKGDGYGFQNQVNCCRKRRGRICRRPQQQGEARSRPAVPGDRPRNGPHVPDRPGDQETVGEPAVRAGHRIPHQRPGTADANAAGGRRPREARDPEGPAKEASAAGAGTAETGAEGDDDTDGARQEAGDSEDEADQDEADQGEAAEEKPAEGKPGDTEEEVQPPPSSPRRAQKSASSGKPSAHAAGAKNPRPRRPRRWPGRRGPSGPRGSRDRRTRPRRRPWPGRRPSRRPPSRPGRSPRPAEISPGE